MAPKLLPTSTEEGRTYYPGFHQFDVIIITGDPYYDHPLSGTALIARLLDKKGYHVAIIPQPQTDEDLQACGIPKYFFCATSGLLDSMLANYTPMLKKRENVYLPERALISYTQSLKRLFKENMVVLGGVEATTRRFTHFDYKENKLRRGILHDTKADLLIHSIAERPLLALLNRMKEIPLSEEPITSPLPPPITSNKQENTQNCQEYYQFEKIRDLLNLAVIEGITFRIKEKDLPSKIRKLPSYEECVADKEQFSLLTRTHYLLPDNAFIEQTGKGFLLHTRPAHPLTPEEMDFIYAQPFTRELHPKTINLEFCQDMTRKMETSVVIGRGCWGSCNFCSIPLVQGKEVSIRSKESIIQEVEHLCQSGATLINDLTLPTLNMYGSYCSIYNQESVMFSQIIDKDIKVYDKKEYCNKQCVGCSNRKLSDELLDLLQEIEKVLQKYNAGMELRSALRHDIILHQKELFRKVMEFTSRLKIAPEHIANAALASMNKATRKDFEDFMQEFEKVNSEQKTHKRLVPYFIAAHPGTTIKDMQDLKDFCNKHRLFTKLTQVFTPTPGTASTATYYSGIETRTKKKVYVARTFRERKDQKNILVEEERY